MKESKKPVEIKLSNLVATIWVNETENGKFFNFTFKRLYKDGNDWKSSQSFGRDDLLLLAKLADMAHTKSYELQSS